MRDTEENHAIFLFLCAMKADNNTGLGSDEEMLILAKSITKLFGDEGSMLEAAGKFKQFIGSGDMSNAMFNEGLKSAGWLGKNCDHSRLKDIFGVVEDIVYSDSSAKGKEGALILQLTAIWGV